MLARCHSACARGLEGEPTEVEVDHFSGNPRFDVVGLPDAAGREARDRVRSAIVNSGYWFPSGRVIVNLAPADSRKVGAAHDLPMALAILAAGTSIPQDALEGRLVFGELALDGRIRPVRGAFLLASTAASQGLSEILAPPGNAREAALATDVTVRAPKDLAEAVQYIAGQLALEVVPAPSPPSRRPGDRDFAEVKGQEAVKRAVTVAASRRLRIGGNPFVLLRFLKALQVENPDTRG